MEIRNKDSPAAGTRLAKTALSVRIKEEENYHVRD